MQQIMSDFVRDGEPLPYTGMRRVVADPCAIALNNQEARNLIAKRGSFKRKVQTLSHEMNGHRNLVGIGIAKRLFSSFFEILPLHEVFLRSRTYLRPSRSW